jgi:hypothetical protein
MCAKRDELKSVFSLSLQRDTIGLGTLWDISALFLKLEECSLQVLINTVES